MKYAVIGDIHGRNLQEFREEIRKEDPDVLLSTSDFDRTVSIHQFMDLKEDFHKEGRQVIEVPGNHDDAIYHNLGINSGTIREQDRESEREVNAYTLHQDLQNDPEAKRYIEDLLSSNDSGKASTKVRFWLDGDEGEGMRSLLIHGAYEGDLSSHPNCPPEKQDFWIRLLDEEDHRDNFDAMEQKGYQVMIRGHDHDPEYAYRDPEKGVEIYEPEDGTAYRLKDDRLHTITHGAWFDGWFATIDTEVDGEENTILQYHNVDQ